MAFSRVIWIVLDSVGIGEMAPTFKLDINGTSGIRVTGPGIYGLNFKSTTSPADFMGIRWRDRFYPLESLRVGGAELRDVPVVLHEPGPGIDGIPGNTVLARYRVTVDGDRRLLHLASR